MKCTNMTDERKPHPVVTALLLLFLFQFFGGGIVVFLNLFLHFLEESVFAIIAVVLLSEFVVLLIVGKAGHVVMELRGVAKHASVEETAPDRGAGAPDVGS
jgi:hypothetical protein